MEASQIRTPSCGVRWPETSSRPSGEKARAATVPTFPHHAWMSFPVAAPQILIVWGSSVSSLPVAISLPSTEYATDHASSRWPTGEGSSGGGSNRQIRGDRVPSAISVRESDEQPAQQILGRHQVDSPSVCGVPYGRGLHSLAFKQALPSSIRRGKSEMDQLTDGIRTEGGGPVGNAVPGSTARLGRLRRSLRRLG